MSFKQTLIASVAVCLVAAAVLLRAFPLWLDAPVRSNKFDPQSHLGPVGTATITPTASPVNTATSTPTITATNTPPPAGSTMTSTPTPTPCLEDGRWFSTTTNANLGTGGYNYFYMQGPGQGGPVTATAGGCPSGACGAFSYYDVTFVASGNYGAITIARGGVCNNSVSSFSTLDFYFKLPSVPSVGCSNFRPMIRLEGSGVAPNDHSIKVTVTAYLVNQGVIAAGNWYEVRIPLSVFNGNNQDGGTFSVPSDLATLKGVSFVPWTGSYTQAGDYSGEVYIGDITFNNAATNTNTQPYLMSDFEGDTVSGETEWGTYWYSYNDRCLNGDCTQPAWPPCASGKTTDISYPLNITNGAAVKCGLPIDIVGSPTGPSAGDGVSPCHVGHIAGYLGDNGTGASDCGTVQPGGDYSYAGMGFDFTSPQGPVSLTGTGTANIAATGIKLYMKLGPKDNGTINQSYNVIVVKQTVGDGGKDYYAGIPDTNLASGTTSTITQTAPCTGGGGSITVAPAANGWYLVTIPYGALIQPSWDTSCVAWNYADVVSIKIEPGNRNTAFDIYSDDITFY